MTQLLTSDFRIRQANNFISNLDAENIYMFVGQTLTYTDANAELISTSLQSTVFDIHDEMVFGKLVSDADFTVMIKNIPWVTGTVYTQYDHEVELSNTEFYVSTLESSAYSVFKCISNAGGVQSTDKPLLSETSPSDDLYKTSDGYIWKLMYTVSESVYDKFATVNYMPFVANLEVSNSAVDGSVDTVEVLDSGTGYSNYANCIVTATNVGSNSKKLYIESVANTALSANTGFYANSAVYVASGPGAGQLRRIETYGADGSNKFITIDTAFSTSLTTSSRVEISPNVTLIGDGTGFRGRLVVDSADNSLDFVEVIDPGTDYTYADALIGSNTAAISTANYSAGSIRAIISPIGGHGYNQQKELFGNYVGISETLEGASLPTANNDYRTFGLIQNPTFNSTTLDLNTVAGLNIGQTITQTATNSSGVIDTINLVGTSITLEQVVGIFETGTVAQGNTNFTVSAVTNDNTTYDQRTELGVTITSGISFDKDELVIQEVSNAEGYVHEFANNTIYLVQTKGTFDISAVEEVIGQDSNTRAVINSIVEADMVKNSGEILYVENLDPITRLDSQNEVVKLVLGF